MKRGETISALHCTLFNAYSSSAAAIGRVDVDQDQARLCGGQLDQQPLRVVLRPDADALAGIEPEPDQSDGEIVGAPLQLAIGPAHVLVPDDQRFALAEAFDDPSKQAPSVSPISGSVLPP